MTKTIVLSGYAQLRNQVHKTLLLGQQKIEQEKIKIYWEAGKLIHEYLLKSKDRADYGKDVIEKLSKDLNVSERSLYETLQFVRAFPNLRSRANLTWSHWRRLATIPDPKRREELVKEAEAREWTSEELSGRLTKIKTLEFRVLRSTTHGTLVTPTLGSFWTYRVIRPELVHSKSNELLLDLGFQVTIEMDRFPNAHFKPDTIVTSTKLKSGSYTLEKSTKTPDQLYTYQAFVERVIDGDTLKVEVDLGFNTRIRQTIRLRGIDAFELDTSEGKRAKEFVERELKNEPFATLKSTKDDKYGRYLGDVFYKKNEYLNQKLLDEKLAVRM